MSANTVKYRDRYIKRAARILPAIQLGVPFASTDIDKIVGGAYSSKFIFYLRELGFQFSQQKDGRKIVSYTLISEPSDGAAIRAATPSKTRGQASASTAAPKAKVARKTKEKSESAPKRAAAKKVARGGNAANLAKLKAVGKKFKKIEAEDREAFLTEDVPATSFSLDNDWDSIEGLDLSKLL